MGRIQSSIGLVTGVPIEDTVNQLIAVSARPRDQLVARTSLLQAEQSAIAELTAAVLGVQFAAEGLGTASVFSKKTASSSDASLVTATVTGAPAATQIQVTPLSQVQSQQLLSGGFAERDTALGAGSITLQRGGFVDPPASLDLLNGGTGVAGGKIRITDRSGASQEIDLRFAQTVDEVIETINAASSINVTASTVGDRFQLTDNTGQSTANLSVTEVSGGSTAADLGLAGIDEAASSATGNDVVKLSEGLLLSQLNDGGGLSLRQAPPDLQISFRDGSADLSIDFAALAAPEARGAATLGDLLDAVNAADPARLQAQISSDGDRLEFIDLTADTGGTFAVSSPFDGELAEELGLTGTASGDTIGGGRLLGGLNSTLLSSLSAGGLSDLGDLSLTDRDGSSVTVDLSAAETLDDVLAAVNDAAELAGVQITAGVNADRNGLSLRDTSGGVGDLIVANGADGKQTADKLGLAVSDSVDSVDSGTLDRRVVSRQTQLSTLNSGAGVAAGKLLITDSDGTAEVIEIVDPEDKTLGDVIDLINASTAGVTAEINDTGDGIRVIDTAGGSGTLSITAGDGSTAAADLSLLGEAQTVEIEGESKQVVDGTARVTIDIGEEDTLEDLVERINSSDFGVTASIISDGSGLTPHRLSLVSQISGKPGELLVDGSGAGIDFSEIVAAKDARLVLGDIALGGIVTSSSTNQFDQIVDGVTLNIQGAGTSPVTIDIKSTDSSVVSSVEIFVTQFNSLRDKIEAHTFFNEENSTTGVLFGSNETLRIESELSRLVTDRFFGVGDVQSLEELGVGFDDEGRLSLDKEKLQAKFASQPEAVAQFFTDETSGFSEKASALLDTLAGEGNSLLINRADTLATKVDLNNERIDFYTARLDRQRELLLTQFYNLETVIARFQENLTVISNLSPLPPLGSTN